MTAAELLRQASAIYAETGLTPDDLVRQRAELLEACKAALAWVCGEPAPHPYEVLTAAIARATGGQQS